jgi:hypothetical protein
MQSTSWGLSGRRDGRADRGTRGGEGHGKGLCGHVMAGEGAAISCSHAPWQPVT